ncbi:MAG: fused response regulator/phosphatase [Rickettsiales bacterium]|nr:fused response regulator/phosphatase [Rickettsiales bacterium]
MIHADISSIRFGDLRVLIVDDSRQSLLIASSILRKQGITQIFFAENGQQALTAAMEHLPDLILLDLLMPQLDGYAFCRAIRQQPGFQETPIIVQTGVEDANGLAQAFEAGASDFVRKPIHASELIARTKVHLERLALLKIINTQNRQFKDELQAAKVMQEMILPSTTTVHELQTNYHLDLAVHHQPCQSLSGDLWSAFALDDHQIAFYQVDFSGHGILAAMNSFRFHALTQARLLPSNEPGAYLDKLNHSLRDVLPRHCFATIFYGVLDTKRSELRYATAAHTAPIILRKCGALESLNAHGFPLSAVSQANYETRCTEFNSGDQLLLYSDALVERWEGFDETSLHALMQQTTSLVRKNTSSAHDMLEHILASFNESRGFVPLEDDLSIIVIRRH